MAGDIDYFPVGEAVPEPRAGAGADRDHPGAGGENGRLEALV